MIRIISILCVEGFSKRLLLEAFWYDSNLHYCQLIMHSIETTLRLDIIVN